MVNDYTVVAKFREGDICNSIMDIEQWDKNLILQIEGLSLPDPVEVHFSLTEYNGEAPVQIGRTVDGITTVEIPEFILENANEEACVIGGIYRAYAFVYVTDGEFGRTEKKIVFHIKARPQPTTEVPDSKKDQFLEEVRGVLNEAKEVAEEKLDDAGYTPNKFLGTDEEGNVVEKDGTGEVSTDVVEKAVEDYLENNPVEIPYANGTNAGIVKVRGDYWAQDGLAISDGEIQVHFATEDIIDDRNSLNPTIYNSVINAQIVDYAVMKALTDSKNHTWTEEQKEFAKTTLGVVEPFCANDKSANEIRSAYFDRKFIYYLYNNVIYSLSYFYHEVSWGIYDYQFSTCNIDGNLISIRLLFEKDTSTTPTISATKSEVAKSSELATVSTTANEALTIAKGANQTLTYGDYTTMITTLNALGNDVFRVGQNIMIVTLNVPDLWVSEIAEEAVEYTYVSDEQFVTDLADGSVQVGYYVLSPLETQKVDLSSYLSEEDIDTTLGLFINDFGKLCIKEATADEIWNRKQYAPITAPMIDYAVKTALINNIYTLTDEEVALELAWLGAVGKNDYAVTNGDGGIVKVAKVFGFTMNDGYITHDTANDTEINNKNGVMAVKVEQIDKAVRSGLAYSKIEWTDDEKASALALLGALANLNIANRIYATDADGNNTDYQWATGAVAGTFARRGANGTLYVGAPTEDLHATTKAYVDSGLASISEMNRKLRNLYFTSLTFSDFDIADQTITGGDTSNTIVAKTNATVESNGLNRMSFTGYITFPTTYEGLDNRIQFGNLLYITPNNENTLLCGNPNDGSKFVSTTDNGIAVIGTQIKLTVDFEVIDSDYKIVVSVNDVEVSDFTITGGATSFTYRSLLLTAGAGSQQLVIKSC